MADHDVVAQIDELVEALNSITDEYLKASQVDLFGKVLRGKLLATDSPLAKSYLNILVDEIVVQDKTTTIKGSYAALAETMQKIKMGTLNQVPTFNLDWRARRDSNS
ncbi:hypothetical protein [Sideroxyarcus emersonii]|uniref:hypothetical protein n=1 Tax=Sideroxyarcus emersonii TaxID=2764705 RepID=UPI001F305A24|nr:hypothetical protein [Sideroxyarcus emersonii]